ncbi:hypothetical protein FHS43_002727 [Streptosporangium becharense]|uniref:Uncharacterized protein n=1 Tax=Streptosporangium becharense TaxID=1816182 RepID=A0A7W9IMA0_9ACTN|nr:hypothetical protein [Streptosporangium becharense]MBB5822728.1 hypothetical protein [Streptosporangium becharense]
MPSGSGEQRGTIGGRITLNQVNRYALDPR